MEELTAALSSSFNVSNEPNTTAAEHPRYSLYKSKVSGSSQDNRRQKVLDFQKRRRFDFQSHVRNLAEGSWTSPGGWEDVTGDNEEENMELEIAVRKPSRSYKNQLMYSEWLVEVPEDFQTEWLTVLCPVGKRCLVISSRGKTKAYAKNGYCLYTFSSFLPGGNKRDISKSNVYCVLDCLYNEVANTFYVLDIMCWKGHQVYESETEFRFYWVKCKFEETPETQEVSTLNPYKFVPLPNFPCTQEAISSAIESANFEIDGLLFYHKRTHYTIGATPLVVWLKPYMVPEIIGITIPDQIMAKRPSTYVNYETHITEVKTYTKMTKNPPSMRQNYNRNKMEVSHEATSKSKKRPVKKGKEQMDTTESKKETEETENMDIHATSVESEQNTNANNVNTEQNMDAKNTNTEQTVNANNT